MNKTYNFVYLFIFLFSLKSWSQQQAISSESVKRSALSFSFPHMLQYERKFFRSEQSFFEAHIGGLPITSVFLLDTKVNEEEYSETHNIEYLLRAWSFSSGLRYGHYLNKSWSLLGDFSIWYIYAGADLHLKNVGTGSKMPFLSVGAGLTQPMFTVSLRKEWSKWSLTMSLSMVLSSSIAIKKSGWFNSFQEVAPDYKEAVNDGSAAAESALSGALNKFKASSNFLPGISVSYRF